MENVDRTIESINKWIQAEMRSRCILDVTPEVIKALAILIEAKDKKREKRSLLRFFKGHD